jgi:hypothetical protein
MYLAKETRACLVVAANDVAIRPQVLTQEFSQHRRHTASRIEVIRALVLSVWAGEVVENQVSQPVQVSTNQTNGVIMVAVESKNSQMVGRGTPVLLAVDCPEETPLGMRGCGHRNMVIEPVDLEMVLNQISCSREVIVHELVCD